MVDSSAGARAASLITASLLVLACGSKPPPKSSETPEIEIEADPVCFPFATGEAAIGLDLAGNYKIAPDAAHKLRAALATARDLVALQKSIEADMKAACGALDAALGAPKKGASADALCGAAIGAMNASRAKLGPKAKIRVVARAPACASATAGTADCLAACEAPTNVDATKVVCEGSLVGTCSTTCDGLCERKAAGPCDGECVGTCDAVMSGACAGACKGKCDGKASKAACAGVCEGKCDAMSRGVCQGKCTGVCNAKTPSACDGICAGKCAGDLADAKCVGDIGGAGSPDCKTRCAAAAMSKLECHGGRVGLAIAGTTAATAKAAAHYRAAIEKDILAVHKIASQGDRTKRVAAEGRAAVEAARTSLDAMARTTRDKAHVDAIVKAMTSCFAEALKAGVDAADAIKAHVDVAENALGAVNAAPAAPAAR